VTKNHWIISFSRIKIWIKFILFELITTLEIFRRGVWLGRHICYKITQMSKDKLKENRNLF